MLRRGEQFGKGIYYRLVYGASKEEKWEIMLVFEEKLLVKTIGSLLGAESEELIPNPFHKLTRSIPGCIHHQNAHFL